MRKKLILVTMILLGTFLLSACAGGAVRGTSWPGMAVDGNAIYLADSGVVYAVNLSDGKQLWKYPGSSKLVFYAPPAITSDGLVVVGSAGTDHSLIALNPKDIDPETNAPVEAWRFTGAKDHWVAAPLVLNNRLFAVNSDGNLYILDLQDGQSVKEATVVKLDGRLWAQPTTDGERIFITSLDHDVIAVDANSYKVLWHEKLGGAIPGSAVLGKDGMLYVGSLASQLEKFDPVTGKHQPVLKANNWIWSTPILDDDTLYFADVDGNLYAFDTSTGSAKWTMKPDGAITASPLIKEDHILVATESGSVFAIDRDGKQVWTQAIGGKIYTTPITAGTLTIVAPRETDFYLAALNATGGQVWTFTPEK